MIYEAGDSFTITDDSAVYAGYLTTACKELTFTIPINKPVFANGFTFNGTIIGRGVNGYIGGTTFNSDTAISLPNDSRITDIEYFLTEAGATLTVHLKEALANTTNNTPVSVTAYESSDLVVTFI